MTRYLILSVCLLGSCNGPVERMEQEKVDRRLGALEHSQEQLAGRVKYLEGRREVRRDYWNRERVAQR